MNPLSPAMVEVDAPASAYPPMTVRATGVIAVMTVFFAFGVNAISHVALLLSGHPLVRDHRGTLQFASAWIGDGVLLPIINIAGAQALHRTERRPTTRTLVAASALGGAVTAALHLLQGAQGLVNWSMPRPWRWNALGLYHAAFMWTQLSFIAGVFLHTFAHVVQFERRVSSRLAIIVACLATFAMVLRFDYRD